MCSSFHTTTSFSTNTWYKWANKISLSVVSTSVRSCCNELMISLGRVASSLMRALFNFSASYCLRSFLFMLLSNVFSTPLSFSTVIWSSSSRFLKRSWIRLKSASTASSSLSSLSRIGVLSCSAARDRRPSGVNSPRTRRSKSIRLLIVGQMWSFKRGSRVRVKLYIVRRLNYGASCRQE